MTTPRIAFLLCGSRRQLDPASLWGKIPSGWPTNRESIAHVALNESAEFFPLQIPRLLGQGLSYQTLVGLVMSLTSVCPASEGLSDGESAASPDDWPKPISPNPRIRG